MAQNTAKPIREVIFLGTGPAGGVKRKGRSRRLESSALLKTGSGCILIDISRNFKSQAKSIDCLNAVVVTHAHKDAVGGFAELTKWLKRHRQRGRTNKITLYALKETIKKIQKNFQQSDYVDLASVKPYQKFQLLGLTVVLFSVKHSIQRGFPTAGYKFIFPDGFSLVYASDAGGWSRKAEKIMKSADVLIIDGAMWGKKIIAHLDIKEILPKLCRWPVKKIIFTQIGKTAPSHTVLTQKIKKICPKALPAYDGLILKF